MLYFCITDGSLTFWAPVDDLGSFIDPAFLIHFDKDIQNGVGNAFIHGKPFSVPVSAAAQLL